MDITSIGHRTDLALLRLTGTEINDHGDHLVVRSPHNPDHWWGNFLLLAGAPRPEQTDHWLARFAAEFPQARHLAFGVDTTDGRTEDLSGFAERGLDIEAATVLTADALRAPAHSDPGAHYRPLRSDDDWSQSKRLRLACDDGVAAASSAPFIARQAHSRRELVTQGHGQWFGAFVGKRLVAQLGIVLADPEVARYQSVETHPHYRRRGIAGALVHRAGAYGLDELAATKLVIVAESAGDAIRIYRRLGFTDTEAQVQAERAPL